MIPEPDLGYGLPAPGPRSPLERMYADVETIKRLQHAPGPLNKKLRKHARQRRRALKAQAAKHGHVVR